jgi:hypothetical protein
MLAATLIRLAACRHLLIVSLCRVVADGRSLEIFGNDLAAFYPAYVHQMSNSLPLLTSRYEDFASWQRERLRGPAGDNLRSFWISRYRDTDAVQLSKRRLQEETPQNLSSAETEALTLETAMGTALRSYARHNALSLYEAMLTAFAIQIYLITQKENFGFWTYLPNRGYPNTRNIIGALLAFISRPK